MAALQFLCFDKKEVSLYPSALASYAGVRSTEVDELTQDAEKNPWKAYDLIKEGGRFKATLSNRPITPEGRFIQIRDCEYWKLKEYHQTKKRSNFKQDLFFLAHLKFSSHKLQREDGKDAFLQNGLPAVGGLTTYNAIRVSMGFTEAAIRGCFQRLQEAEVLSYNPGHSFPNGTHYDTRFLFNGTQDELRRLLPRKGVINHT